jgi:hypothetical protein
MNISQYKPRNLRVALALTSALGLAACGEKITTQTAVDLPGGQEVQVGQVVGGATRQMTNVQPVGGFLPEPGLLQPGGNGRPALFYRNPSVRMGAYTKIMLDPVEIWAAPDSQLNTLPMDQRNAAANTFYSDLFTALKKRCTMVTKPGPGTLRMKFALVDTKLPNAAVNTVATFAPYASTAYSVASVAFNGGVGYFAGNATAEGYAVDSRSGVVIWQAVDKRGGTTSFAENTLDTWLDVHHAFEAWAAALTTKLVAMGVCH